MLNILIEKFIYEQFSHTGGDNQVFYLRIPVGIKTEYKYD